MVNYQKLVREDLSLPCKELALYLLGKLLVHKLDDGSVLKGRIVETEAYLGGEDKASNTYGGRQTPGNQPLYMPAGTAYIYMTYGMYHCFNISSPEPGAGVLLRAIEPTEGVDLMHEFRSAKLKSKKRKPFADTELGNGPSKLCMSMNITKDVCNKLDLCENELLWLEDDGEEDAERKIVETSRIGIASAGAEWAQKPLRFYILSNPHVSKIDKKAEIDLLP